MDARVVHFQWLYTDEDVATRLIAECKAFVDTVADRTGKRNRHLTPFATVYLTLNIYDIMCRTCRRVYVQVREHIEDTQTRTHARTHAHARTRTHTRIHMHTRACMHAHA